MSANDSLTLDAPYVLKVNGVQLEFGIRVPTGRAILELAKEHGAIPLDPEKYFLKGDKGTYRLEDRVDLTEDSVFITVVHDATQIAASPRQHADRSLSSLVVPSVQLP